MPHSETKDAIVIALDVGKSVSTLHYWENKTFFEQARDCVSWIIQRKIISESSDVLSLLLVGSEESDNCIAKNGYKNIKAQYNFQLASWEMLKFIENDIKTSKIESDWLGGLIVSIEMLKSFEETTDICNKTIVFFSDFIHPASDDLDVVIKSIQAFNIEIIIIGPEHIPLMNNVEKHTEPANKKLKKEIKRSKERQQGEKLVYKIFDKLKENVRICTFESALKQLCSHSTKARRVTPWNCLLDIGEVKINISLLKKTDSKTSKSFNSKCLKPPGQEPGEGTSDENTSLKETIPAVRDKVLQYKQETGVGNEILNVEVKQEDTIEGYRYGMTVIPFSEEDKAAFRFQHGPKCFSVIGFTNITSVPYYLLSGDTSYIVVPRNKDKNAEIALSAIIQAMKKMECLGIVRRVYSDNSGLSLGILYPIVEEIVCDETDEVTCKEYLLFVELAFEEDIKSVTFPSLNEATKSITKQQYDVVDKLIDKMNLMKADRGLRGEPCEAFDLPYLHDVKKQFLHYCIIQRGLHSEKPLPTSLPPYIENFIRTPKSVEENCKNLIKDLQKEFKIIMEKPAIYSNNDKLSPKKSKTHQTDATVEIPKKTNTEAEHFEQATINKESDSNKRIWMELFAKGFPKDPELDMFFEKHAGEFKSQKLDLLNSFQNVFFQIRNTYMKVNPDVFNCWMEKFKSYMKRKSGVELELWEIIVTENLGLISERENKYSNVAEEEAEEFLCESISKSTSCYTPKKLKPDFGPPPECLNELEAESVNKQNDMTSNGAHLEMTSPSSPVMSERASSSTQTNVINCHRYRQRQLGPAPFASFEDLSDELDSPPETARIPLPGIKEDPSSQLQSPVTPLPQGATVQLTGKEEQGLKDALTSSLDTPAPPRIDISRASSSSQHEDSITSSPERENGTHNLGYKEDGTVDLRSSTEELDYIQEPGTVQESEEKRKREKMMKRQQQVRDFCDTQSQHELMERKDSSCSVMSDTGLLCISGRTSRLSSIGSAASGGSVASGASHLSAGSHLSERSTRSPSPHKMLLETSFCGSKPILSQNVESEVSPGVDTVSNDTESRPPSRFRSRSPSPHKMLLETSFCGSKQVSPLEINSCGDFPKPPEKITAQTSSSLVTEVEIIVEKIPKQDAVEVGKAENAKIEETPKAKADETVRVENAAGSVKVTGKPKTITPPKKMSTKPKKIISIRDIPGDEIYIPLKGPEVDLEEIIRSASPDVKKKTARSAPSHSSDEIIIPLHSPGDEEKKPGPGKDSGDGIYIPLHSPPKSSKANVQKSTPPKTGEGSSKTKAAQQGQAKPKKNKYEVCEDGSIFIPLHSPDEDRTSNNFEDEIRRVDEELQKAREAAAKRLREEEEEEKQTKPATLDFSDSESRVSRLSQTYYSAKSEVPSGGSRTPSPGSTLSRKSSFASLFRKSDVFSSPDSQGGSVARKKSGTFTNFLKDASDGLRERSRSRSKSRERPTQSSNARSPSGKKNVFTNLFAKKKGDSKVVAGKENEQLSPRLDLQFTFNSENKKESDEGDYIIIPLRDPSQPPDCLDNESQEEPAASTSVDETPIPSTSFVILEKSQSSKLDRGIKELQDVHVEVVRAEASPVRDLPSEDKSAKTCRSSSESKELDQRLSEATLNENDKAQAKVFADSKRSSGSETQSNSEMIVTSKSPTSVNLENLETERNGKYTTKDKIEGLQHDSSLENDDKDSKEEILAVSDGGIRKLKLPPEPGDLEEDHERKGLVYQESFEDELPYIPTTLPLERPVGVHIVPVKHRVTEIKTFPIERPRSTTPINPTSLEDFVTSREAVAVSAEEKMKISLPRDDSITSKSKSPRRFSAKGKTWFEFAEAGLQSPRDNRKNSLRTTPSPPPLPPRSSPPSVLSSSAPPVTLSWINFEELPEKKKLPKRITTVPTLRSSTDGGEKSSTSVAGSVIYSYVSPEDCQCECHEHSASPSSRETHSKRGQKNDFMLELKTNHESFKKGFTNKSKSEKPLQDNEKCECKDCENGKHRNTERDIEETPLLDVSSDEEIEDFLKKAQDWTAARSGELRLEVDKTSNLSDSSYECASHEGVHDVEHNRELKPFEMDLEVESDCSSLISQDMWQSSDDNNRNLQ